jgi:CubicO group peptidase (beta-lactamase class C family)
VDFAGVGREIEAAIEAGAFPGAVVLVARDAEIVFHEAFGVRTREPEPMPMQPDTIFDLSSLTKPLATTLAFMLLVRERKVELDDRVTRFFPNFAVHGKTKVTFRSLLAHYSGLAAWRPFYKEIAKVERRGKLNFMASRGAKDWVYQQIHRERQEYDTGAKSIYSDLGFMLLGELIELITRMPLDRFCHERIFRPLKLRSTGFVDLSVMRAKKLVPVTDELAPTERCPWRRKVLWGEVHDDNAYAMGGVAGHAGLFAGARDVHAVLTHLTQCRLGGEGLVTADIMREFWTRDGTVEGSTWALGWDMPTEGGSSAGSRITPTSVGHLGYTGTSAWIDLERRAHVVLLTNRVHPTRDNDRIRAVRPRIHDAVFEALDA